MSSKYQIEALLRPPVELWSACLAFCMSIVVVLFQYHLFMSPMLAWVTAALFIMFGLFRTCQGWRILRYQSGLTRLPRYTMKRSRIPVSNKRLFVGRGFRWEQKHTQRLRDCLLPGNASYLKDSLRFRVAGGISERLEKMPFSFISKALDWDHWLNPVRPPPLTGGRPEIHGVGMYDGEGNIYSPLGERVGHMLVLGTTRVGKSRLAEVFTTQDIMRGDTVIVFDPKGDSELLKSIYAACENAKRLDNFYMFHLAYPEYSARYNPVGSYSRITQVATRIANGLPGEGNSSAFKEFGWRFTNIIARALHTLGKVPTYSEIHRYVSNIDELLISYGRVWLAKSGPDDWEERVNYMHYGLTGHKDDENKPNVPAQTLPERSHDVMAVCMARILNTYMSDSGNHDPVAQGLLSAFKYDRTYFDKIVSSLGPFLEKLTTGAVSELFSPDYTDTSDDRPIFDWQKVIRTNSVVYVGLAALQDVTVASAVGNAMFADLTAVAGELYAHGASPNNPVGNIPYKKVTIHADEFNELIGDEFIPMLNKAGGAGYQVTAYTQTWADIEARLGNRAKAEQVAGNFNTMIMLRVRNSDTAELLTQMLPMVQVAQLTTVSTANHSTEPGSDKHFGSSVQNRVTTADVSMIEPGDLTRLPKGQAFLVKEGGQLFKLRLPLPAQDKGIIPSKISELTVRMRRDYSHAANDTWAHDTWWSSIMPKQTIMQQDFEQMHRHTHEDSRVPEVDTTVATEQTHEHG